MPTSSESPSAARPVRIALAGAAGRMGRRVARMLADHPTLALAAALERTGAATELPEAAGALVTDDPDRALAVADVLMDFSAPPAAATLAPLCASRGVAYLVASTGLGSADATAVDDAGRRVAVLQAANLSLGVNVMLDLVERAARALGPAFEVEIAEIHHRHKRDAPSGTALALGKAVERGRGRLSAVEGRRGIGDPRRPNELGFASLRGGDVAGEHTVYFFGESERLELTHRATSLDIFARGALVAAAWLAGKPAGRYTMRDVIGE